MATNLQLNQPLGDTPTINLPPPTPLTATQSLSSLSGTPSSSSIGGDLTIAGQKPPVLPGINNPSGNESTALTPGQFNTPPKPTSVVSAAPAMAQVNQAKNVVNNPPAQSLYDTTNGFVTAYGLSQGAKPVQPGDPAMAKTGTSATPAPTSTPAPTPEETIAHDGQTQYFNLNTGKQEWVNTPTDGSTPSGYSATDPINGVVSNSFSSSDGSNYKQLPDGTYVKYNPTTNTLQTINAGTFNAQQQISKDTQALNDLKNNGTFTPTQQAQIDGITAQYQALIDKQNQTNANTTGVVTAQQARFGQGVASSQGEITKTVQDGIASITKLTTEMNSAIASMKAGFLTDDENAVKDGWNTYTTSQQEMQKDLDAVQANLAKQQENVVIKQQNQNIADSAKYSVDIPSDATPEQALEIKQSSPIYKYEQTTKAGVADPDVTDAQLKYYKTTGSLPTFSYGTLGHAERNAFWSAVGGNPSTVIDATSNKAALHAATTAQARLATLKAGTVSSISALKTGIGIAEDEINKLPKTNSPFLNKPIQWVQDQLAGNKNYSALNQALSTIATEYAKIKNGASASIAGAPVTSVEEEKKLLTTAMTTGQIESTLDIIKKDSNGRLLGFDAGLDSIASDIKDLQSTDINGDQGSSSSSSSSSSGSFAEQW